MNKRIHSSFFIKNKNIIIFLLLILILISGTIVGSVLSNNLDNDLRIELKEYIGDYIEHDTISFISKADMLKDSMIKYGKTIVILWVLAFIPIGFIMSFIIIFLKGTSYGFTTAFLVMNQGLSGLKFGFKIYFFPNIFLIIAYLLIVFFGYKYAFSDRNTLQKDKFSFFEYLITLLIAIVLLFLACAIEVFLVQRFL